MSARANVAEAAFAILLAGILQSNRADSKKLFLSLTYSWLNTYKEIGKDCSHVSIWCSKASLEPVAVRIPCTTGDHSLAAPMGTMPGCEMALWSAPTCGTGSSKHFMFTHYHWNINYSWFGLLYCSVFFSGDSFSNCKGSRAEDRAAVYGVFRSDWERAPVRRLQEKLVLMDLCRGSHFWHSSSCRFLWRKSAS